MVLIACHCVPYGCFVCFTCFCSSPCNCCLVLITSNGLLKKPAQVAAVPPIKKSITLEFVFESLKKIMTQTIKHKLRENKWAKVKQTTLLTTTHNRILPQNFIKLCHFCLTFILFLRCTLFYSNILHHYFSYRFNYTHKFQQLYTRARVHKQQIMCCFLWIYGTLDAIARRHTNTLTPTREIIIINLTSAWWRWSAYTLEKGIQITIKIMNKFYNCNI